MVGVEDAEIRTGLGSSQHEERLFDFHAYHIKRK